MLKISDKRAKRNQDTTTSDLNEENGPIKSLVVRPPTLLLRNKRSKFKADLRREYRTIADVMKQKRW